MQLTECSHRKKRTFPTLPRYPPQGSTWTISNGVCQRTLVPSSPRTFPGVQQGPKGLISSYLLPLTLSKKIHSAFGAPGNCILASFWDLDHARSLLISFHFGPSSWEELSDSSPSSITCSSLSLGCLVFLDQTHISTESREHWSPASWSPTLLMPNFPSLDY